MQTVPFDHSRGRFQTRDDPNFVAPKFSIKENPKVAACSGVPRLGFTDFYDSAAALYQAKQGILRSQVVGLWWEKNLSVAIRNALAKNPDYILCLDYDSVFSVHDVEALVSAMQQNPELAAVWATQISRHNERILCHETGLDFEKPIMSKTFGHFGLTIFRAEVFRTLPKPWFFATPGMDGEWDAPDAIDSDISFWRLMNDHGFRCAQHNRVVIGHLELAVRWPKHNRVQLQPVDEFRKHGKPTDAIWTGKPPKAPSERTNLFLGEGPVRAPGVLLVDDRDGECFPLNIPDNTVGTIRAANVLNRMPHRIRHHALADWVRALKPGGVIMLTVPNFRKIAGRYLAGDCPNAESIVYGSQDTDCAANASMYDENVVRELLQSVGLIDIKIGVKIEDNDQFAGWEWLHSIGTKPITVPPGTEWEHPDKKWDFLTEDMAHIDAQFGEDAILERLVTAADICPGWCMEVGGGDGLTISNTVWCRRLNWPTVLIEADPLLHERASHLPGVTPICLKIAPTGPTSVDAVLDNIGCPDEMNLMVIDIDGDDYHVLANLRRRPKMLVVEFRNTNGMACKKEVPAIGEGQATQPAVVELARSMGYELAANTLVNAILVRADIAEKIHGGKAVSLIHDGDGIENGIEDWSDRELVMMKESAD